MDHHACAAHRDGPRPAATLELRTSLEVQALTLVARHTLVRWTCLQLARPLLARALPAACDRLGVALPVGDGGSLATVAIRQHALSTCSLGSCTAGLAVVADTLACGCINTLVGLEDGLKSVRWDDQCMCTVNPRATSLASEENRGVEVSVADLQVRSKVRG